MSWRGPAIFFSVALLVLTGPLAAAQKLYRWVDSNGVVHYGDHVPPEYADRDRDILNRQGVAVGFEKGELSEAEIAERDRQAREREEQQKEADEAARRDRMLLDTYVSVSDIEKLRDQRIELLESQIKVTEQYLGNLRKRLRTLERDVEKYKQSPTDGETPNVPENLALEVSRTVASIDLYEESLKRTRVAQDELRAAFAVDIDRFIELTEGNL